MKLKHIVIIGGGASGLMCALTLLNRGYAPTIVEADVKLGKKLLKTGNGRCNLTNMNISSNSYNQSIQPYLNQFSVQSTLNFFNGLGLETYADEQGRVYPQSNLASSVLELFTDIFEVLKPNILLQTKVEEVLVENGNFKLKTNNEAILCKNLVIACGGEAGIGLCKNLGLKTKPQTPSLCGLKVSQNLQELVGIRQQNVCISLECGNIIAKEMGEILFKENSVSGICVFNLSAIMARENQQLAKLSIDLLPHKTLIEITENLQHRKLIRANMQTSKLLNGMFHKNLGREILKRAGLNEKENVSTITNKHLQEVAKVIKNFCLNVVGMEENQQVHAGGVLLSEVKSNLESVKLPNLFLCGEILDVDGLCGGYNLQWAWTSGKIVGESINEK